MALRCFYTNYIPGCAEILSELPGDISRMEYPNFRRSRRSSLPGSVLRGGRVNHRHTRVRPDKCDGLLHADVIANASFKLRVDVDIARRHDERQCAFVDRNRCRTGRLEAVLERTCDQLLAVVRLDGQLDLFAGSSQVRGAVTAPPLMFETAIL